MKSSLVGQVFSSVAQSYDVMNDLMSAGMHRLWKDTLVERLRPFAGMKHLDVAGGTGDVAFRVLRAIRQAEAEERLRRGGGSARPRGAASSAPASSSPPQSQQHQQQQPGSLTVLDINPQMLEVGKQKAAQQPELAREGAGGGLAFVVGDAEKLPFADDTFDGYTIAFGIRNVTDRDAALREARRVLRPGGHFLCLEFSHVQQAGLREIYDAYSFHVIPKIGEYRKRGRGVWSCSRGGGPGGV